MNRPATLAIICAVVGLADVVWMDAWLLPAWASAATTSTTTSSPTIAAAALHTAATPVEPRAPERTAAEPTASATPAPAAPAAAAPAAAAPAAAAPAPAVAASPELVVVDPDESPQSAGAGRIPIYFVDTGSAELGADARASLLALAGRMRDDASLRVIVRGHADARGTRRDNFRLSRRRAQAVARELGVHGIDEQRISLAWFGERKPAVRGSNPRAWAANRRVELDVKGRR